LYFLVEFAGDEVRFIIRRGSSKFCLNSSKCLRYVSNSKNVHKIVEVIMEIVDNFYLPRPFSDRAKVRDLCTGYKVFDPSN